MKDIIKEFLSNYYDYYIDGNGKAHDIIRATPDELSEELVKLFAISDVSVAKRTVCVRNNRECLHLKDNIWCLQNHFDCEFKQTES